MQAVRKLGTLVPRYGIAFHHYINFMQVVRILHNLVARYDIAFHHFIDLLQVVWKWYNFLWQYVASVIYSFIEAEWRIDVSLI